MPVKPFPFLIGSDPEFNLLFQNKRLNASTVLRKLCKDVEWKDMGWTTPNMKGEMGYDGCEATGEIRPEPSNTVDGCVENFRSIMKESFERIGGLSLSSLSIFAPAGGHLHLDFPQTWEPTKTKNAVQKLMSFYLPITLGENPISRAIRQQNYGGICDYRTTEHTSSRSVEIRCPSAEWTTTPKVMRATLAYIGTVWNEVLHHEASLHKFNKILMKTDRQLTAMYEMAMSEHPLMIELLFNQIKSAVRKFEFYNEYKKDIELLFNPKKITRLKTESGYDLFKGWGLKKKTMRLSHSTFSSQTKIKKELRKKKLSDEFIGSITLPYNDDKNVETFARALESRMLALDWRPKNRYYLFGIKEGVKEIIAGKEESDMIKLSFGHSLAKNNEDKSAIEESVRKMVRRGKDSCSRDTQIDPKKGIVLDNRPCVAIGIPFDWRGERITKVGKVMEAVWKMENGLAFTNIEIVTAKKPIIDAGETAKKLNDEETITLDESIDCSSQGRDFANSAILSLEREFGRSLQPTITEVNSNGSVIDLTAGIVTPTICAE